MQLIKKIRLFISYILFILDITTYNSPKIDDYKNNKFLMNQMLRKS